MLSRLVTRRTLWWPTWLGWFALGLLFLLPAGLWVFFGEHFLSATHRQPPEVLVVEGWIGPKGVAAAKAEFLKGNYRWIVTTSGLSGESWSPKRWHYAMEAGNQLMRLGLPQDRVLCAIPQETGEHRTFESAVAARRVLEERGIRAGHLNLFTRGTHARRSELVFTKAFSPETKVGVVAWIPVETSSKRWWRSSDRAKDFVQESLAYAYELLANSGRWSNRATLSTSDKSVR